MNANITDITDITDAVMEVYLNIMGGADAVDVDHLTTTERRMLAELMGWEPSDRKVAWLVA